MLVRSWRCQRQGYALVASALAMVARDRPVTRHTVDAICHVGMCVRSDGTNKLRQPHFIGYQRPSDTKAIGEQNRRKASRLLQSVGRGNQLACSIVYATVIL